MRQIGRRDTTPEIVALVAAGLLAVLAVGAVAGLAGQLSGARTPTSPIRFAPAEERAPATPASTLLPTVQQGTEASTAPSVPTAEPKISTPLPSEKIFPTEIPYEAPSSFQPGSNRIPLPSIPPQN